jgi:hypothetical protein
LSLALPIFIAERDYALSEVDTEAEETVVILEINLFLREVQTGVKETVENREMGMIDFKVEY